MSEGNYFTKISFQRTNENKNRNATGFKQCSQRTKQDRNVVITLKDAERLSDSLTQVMTRLVSVQEDVINAYKTASEAQTINIEMDGGNFSKK